MAPHADVPQTSRGLDGRDPSKPAPTKPVVARMYDWYLNGTHNYAVDRKAGEDVQKALPDIKALVLENRAFVCRAARWLTKQGVRQFIDLGSGLPTVMSTHETAQKLDPSARVLYVDIEETCVIEANEIIHETGVQDRVGMIQGNALEPDYILDHPETKRLIDFSKPVAVLMIALAHFFAPDKYVPVIYTFRNAIKSGGYFVMTHVTCDERDPEGLKVTEKIYERAALPVYFRTRADILPVMDGWELVDPGLARPEVWKMEEMEEGEKEPPITKMWWVAVGKKP